MLFRPANMVYVTMSACLVAVLAVSIGSSVALADDSSREKSVVAERPPSVPRADLTGLFPEDWPDLCTSFEQLLKIDASSVRKQNLGEIVTSCDEISESIQRRVNQSGTSQAVGDTIRNELLYRSARALAYMELPGAVVTGRFASREHRTQRFEETYKKLSERVDVTSEPFLLLHIRWLRRHEKHREALTAIENALTSLGHNRVWRFWLTKKRRDVLGDLNDSRAVEVQKELDADFGSWIAYFDQR